MTTILSQVLPALSSLGVVGYWIIGACAALEAFAPTGVFFPGTLIVDAGGVLVHQGLLDFFDLVWFVAFGAILGGEATFALGRAIGHGRHMRSFQGSRAYTKAERLFARYGGLALVFGRFLGPVSSLAPLAAALANMPPRLFRIWNFLSAFPFALVHVSIGYSVANILRRLSPDLTKEVLVSAGIALIIGVFFLIARRVERYLPFLGQLTQRVIAAVLAHPKAATWLAHHPKITSALARRFDRTVLSGWPATVLICAASALLITMFVLSFDVLRSAPIVGLDMRLAAILHVVWSPALLTAFSHLTALGDPRAIACFAAAALAAFWALGRRDLCLGIVVALITDIMVVATLKAAFGRPRSLYGYFTETSGSFPSGHAAISIAFWGMLAYALWRIGRLGPLVATWLACVMAAGIGGSRIYLVEHYLSDVLGGWIIGALAMLAGVTFAEWSYRTHIARPARPKLQRMTAGLCAVLVGLALLRVVQYDHPRNLAPVAGADSQIAQPLDKFATADLPTAVTDITGEIDAKLSFVILSPDAKTLQDALQKQGWTKVPQMSPMQLLDIGATRLLNRARAQPSAVPLFWSGVPNDMIFTRPATDSGQDQSAHAMAQHLRLWRSTRVTPQGQRLWLANLRIDRGLDPEKSISARSAITAFVNQQSDQSGADLKIPVITLP
ncbi:hypothetical protein BFP70_13030 [Thioclava sp. SK-1]|uniref:bifunctional DedA family/phosphatase PAP2 family protein n=1 Tax=Thioclava sp. SK-1 TaxID=1889770 RepID=UPI000825A8AB|nr:bifunctional DedA family/phosphatase PAP2 family protein [Thioclava sp. SK-1]OCX63127.1 hypothetical protein BFP70_13030 [Thioclava sp. SK-1]